MRDLLLKPRLVIESIDIPDIGKVYLRRMSGSERDAYEHEQFTRKEQGTELQNFRSRLLVRCLCDETGKLILTAEDATQLGQQDSTIVVALFDRAAKLNGMDAASQGEAKKN